MEGGPPSATVEIRQVASARGWTLSTNDAGQARGHLAVTPSARLGFAVLHLPGTDAAVAVGVGGRELHVLASGVPAAPVEGVVWAPRSTPVHHRLGLAGGHLVVGPGVTLTFAAGAGVHCAGGSIHLLGTGDQPVSLAPAEAEPWGGLRLVDGRATLTHATVQGAASADDGGGLAAYGSELELHRVALLGCQGRSGGGLFAERCVVAARGLTLQRNVSRRDGGGLALTDTHATLQDLAVGGEGGPNRAGGDGGGLWANVSRLALDRGTIAGNHADGQAHDVFAFGSSVTQDQRPLAVGPGVVQHLSRTGAPDVPPPQAATSPPAPPTRASGLAVRFVRHSPERGTVHLTVPQGLAGPFVLSYGPHRRPVSPNGGPVEVTAGADLDAVYLIAEGAGVYGVATITR